MPGDGISARRICIGNAGTRDSPPLDLLGNRKESLSRRSQPLSNRQLNQGLIEKSLLVRYSFSVWKRRNGRDQLELQLLPSVQDEQRLSGVRPLLLLCISLAGRQETVLMC
ncbi:hypothetical protein BS78_06G038900 [Paspalum vaginatum]|nr:hypothetical protein BS78_06G038900 [Paspalum vaginatum]KAJ1270239.1 hypothetical protein BS78_06G038900 [Paspalum vaginatum]